MRGEDEAPCQVDGRMREGGRTADRDAALRAGLEIYAAVAAAGCDEKLQVRQLLDQGAREGGALPHRQNGVAGLQPVQQRGAGDGVAVLLDLD
ncbi:hypothetical protein [Dankookia sp. P2]|uniref:hypothetical protein n=1 Tax=Dankookia sp. P2 TaxID=3423955 RepID=UPI003D671AC2